MINLRKTTITSIALAMSASNAFAIVGPNFGGEAKQPVERTICLDTWQIDGLSYASDCDSNAQNIMFGREILPNGCASEQVAIKTTKLEVRSCPTFVQL